MKDDVKETTSVFIKKSIISHAKINPRWDSLSDWVNENYPQQEMNLEQERRELMRLKEEQKNCEKRIKQLEQEEQNNQLDSSLQKWFDKDAPLRLAKGIDRKALHRWFKSNFNTQMRYSVFNHYLEESLKKI